MKYINICKKFLIQNYLVKIRIGSLNFGLNSISFTQTYKFAI